MTPAEALRSRFNELPNSDREFAGSLLRCRFPSPKQAAWIETLVARLDAAKAAAAVPAAQVDNVAGIVAMLSKGATTLKRPKVRFLSGDLHLVLSISGDRSRAPGSINVVSDQDGGPWYGRIHRDGCWEPHRTLDQPTSTAIVAALQAFAANPEKVAAEYGRRMGACCYCGRALVDPVSVFMGYGPICAERYGLAHRATGLTTEAVDKAAETEAALHQAA